MLFYSRRGDARTRLHLAEKLTVEGKSRQRVVAAMGRMEQLKKSEQIEAIMRCDFVNGERPTLWPDRSGMVCPRPG
jgi:hypothetical protein